MTPKINSNHHDDPNWKPDYGIAKFNEKSGATAVGAREFLIAYNINLNTNDRTYANEIAYEIRERGRWKRTGNINPFYYKGDVVYFEEDKYPDGNSDFIGGNFEELSNDIKSLISESEKKSQTKINSINLNIPMIDSLSRYYESGIENLEQQITDLDIKKVIKNKIIKFLPVSKQVLMFSATIPNNILKLSSKYLNDPVRISVGESNTVAKNIKQEIIELKSDEKLDELINQITNRNGSILIFVKTKYGTEKLSKALSRSKIKSFPLHGGLRQSKRNTIMKNFRDMKFRILIATDVAARGIDVPHIEHVINYDLQPLLSE